MFPSQSRQVVPGRVGVESPELSHESESRVSRKNRSSRAQHRFQRSGGFHGHTSDAIAAGGFAAAQLQILGWGGGGAWRVVPGVYTQLGTGWRVPGTHRSRAGGFPAHTDPGPAGSRHTQIPGRRVPGTHRSRAGGFPAHTDPGPAGSRHTQIPGRRVPGTHRSPVGLTLDLVAKNGRHRAPGQRPSNATMPRGTVSTESTQNHQFFY